MEKFIKKINIIYYAGKSKTEDFILLTLNKVVEILSPKTFKRLLFLFFFFFIFFIFQKQINLFIEETILVKPDFSNMLLDSIFVLTFVITNSFVLIKTIKHKYVPSYNDVFITSSILLILCYYDFLQKWNPLKINLFFFKLEYISLIVIPLILYLGIIIFNYLYPIFHKEAPEAIKNIFINDNPILNSAEDKLDASKVANNLIQILNNEKHETCFSIGLVGPWGNGKSSVFKMVCNHMFQKQHKNKNNDDVIIVNFLPSLNHKEDDIINEFFVILSNELSKFNGKLSSQLMLYSQKITNLYKDKNIFNFLEKHITKIDSTSACELYHEINNRLIEINKKIIVFVDDLDRLNEKEILQVLKLIRNTANFKNTIFVVAMDKEYVLDRLKSDKDILNVRFIDKFFQLEIYLPEIDNSILRNYFFDIMKESILSTSSDFENQLFEAMSNEDNLFNDYVKNIRDVKRIVNQIVYDYPIFKKEIDLKDFMNFTYFKLKFPKYLRLLNDRKADFIYIDRQRGTYNLIKKKPSKNQDDILDELNKVKLYNIGFLNKYETKVNECHNSDLNINCEDRTLLVKTLAYLFGEENTVPDVNSIKNEINFRMLVEQRIFSNYFTQSEFEQLYDADDNHLQVSLLLASNFYQDKLSLLIKRLNDFNTNDEHRIKRTIQILIILFNEREYYKLYGTELLLLLETFVQRQLTTYRETNVYFSSWLETNVFENEKYSIETKLYLFSHLWKSKGDFKYWNLSEKFITNNLRILYKNYLDKFEGVLWDVNDYNSYGIYHAIKSIDIEVVNDIYKSFWKSNSIELLCAQTVDLDSFSNVNFKITDTVNEIFGKRNNFISFVQSHKDKDLPEIKEFIKLFNLLQIINFSDSVIFEFKISKLMLEKIAHVKKHPGRAKYSEDENLRQIFIETNNTSLTEMILHEDTFEDHLFRRFLHNKKDYIVVTFKKQGFEEMSFNFVKGIINVYPKPLTFKFNEKSIEEELLIKMDDETYLKIISIQPPKNAQEPNYEIH